MEFGCGELGRYDEGAKGSKELRESFLKAPKMMKDELAALIAKPVPNCGFICNGYGRIVYFTMSF